MIRYRLKEMIEKSGLSYRKLAEEMGINFTTLHKLAQAKNHEDYNLCTETIDKICTYFDCQPNDFMRFSKK